MPHPALILNCFEICFSNYNGSPNKSQGQTILVKIVKNTYAFIEEYIDPNAPEGKEHIGYIVDRVGFDEFCKWALEGVELPEKCQRATRVYWDGKRYDRDNSLR